MIKKNGRVVYLLLAVVLGLASRVGATQEAQQAAKASPEQALKERANAYYNALVKGDKVTAYGFVAPESKNDFFTMGNLSAVDIRILGFELSNGAGDTAKVKIQESVTPPLFHEPLDLHFEDSWKSIDGEWFIVLPDSHQMDSPFGKMSFEKHATPQGASPESAPSPAQGTAPDLDQIKRRVQASTKNADADEYLLALKKAQLQAQAGKAKDSKGADQNGEKSDPAPDQNSK